MHNLDFSSWPALLSTLAGLVLMTLIGIGLRLIVMRSVPQRRERQNRRINERLKTLIAASKTLGVSFTGTLSIELVAGRAVETSKIVISLRDFIRSVLELVADDQPAELTRLRLLTQVAKLGRSNAEIPMNQRFIAIVTPLVAAAVFLIAGIPLPTAAQDTKNPAMSKNKQTVQEYMHAFGKTDHATILSCLTDDIEWFIPGAFRIAGKAAFDKEIENDEFVGSPTITVSRMVEEQDIVVAEGSVRTVRKGGGILNLLFCDIFEMRNAKIKRLTSYLMEVKDEPSK